MTTFMKVDQICRLCMAEARIMFSLFDKEATQNNVPLSDRIASLIPIKMNEYDGLPSLVCSQCIHMVNQFHGFKARCEKSDKTLCKLFKQANTNEATQEAPRVSYKGYVPHTKECVDSWVCGKQSSTKSGTVHEVPPVGCYVEIEENGKIFTFDEDGDCRLEDTSLSEPQLAKYTETCNKNSVNPMMGYETGRCADQLCGIGNEGSFTKSTKQLCHKVKEIPAASPPQSGDSSFLCTVCGEIYNDKIHFQEHIAGHATEKEGSSSHNSDRLFDGQLNLKACLSPTHHKVFFDGKSTPKEQFLPYTESSKEHKHFSCDMCEKVYAQKRDLVVHMRQHREGNPFQCSECKEVYVSHVNLVKHLKNHKKGHECVLCGKLFASKNLLVAHIRSHVSHVYHCTICEKEFATKASLEYHRRIHTG